MKPDFDSLVESHQKEIFIYLWRLLGEPQDAEDCLQDTFLKAYMAYSRFREPGNPRAWLYRIATNTAFSSLKRSGRTRAYSFEDGELSADTPPLLELVEARAKESAVRQAVDDLPAQQRSALIMRKYQEMSYSEIGEVLGCSPDSARSNVYQALRKLRLRFDERQRSEVLK
jgi:RNA polymerase sigma-70 factor, ECF subfamily